MPSKSPEQHRLMEAAAHTPGGYGGVPQSVGREFVDADKGGDPPKKKDPPKRKDPPMGVLTAAARKSLKTSDFALPKERAYPIHDETHARNALERVSQFGTPEEKAKVRAAVKRRYPGIDVSGGKQMSPNEAPSR